MILCCWMHRVALEIVVDCFDNECVVFLNG